MPPEINFVNEKNNGNCLLRLIDKDLILSSHDISSGGLITALAEMSFSSKFGAKIYKPIKLTNLFEYFFGEDQARYLIEIESDNLTKAEEIIKKNDVYYEKIGFTQKEYLEVEGELKISINDLFKVNNEWYNNY